MCINAPGTAMRTCFLTSGSKDDTNVPVKETGPFTPSNEGSSQQQGPITGLPSDDPLLPENLH